jgi:hypothetical protein
MATRTTYHSLEEIGIPRGSVPNGDPIYLAQDEFTRNYHRVDAHTFIRLCDDSWRKDEVMSISYSGNIGLIDLPTQTIAHIYDTENTTQSELENFEALVGEELFRIMNGGKQ